MSGAKTITALPAGLVTAPPSKSLSHRALICAGLAALQGGGESRLHHVGGSVDIAATQGVLQALGVSFSGEAGGALHCAPGAPPPAGQLLLDCAESGSTLRFIIPIAAALGHSARFTGRGRLMQRPQGPYADAFAAHGVPFGQSDGGLWVQGPLPGGVYRLPGDVSSQFISGLLLALPLTRQESKILLAGPLESAGYVALTLDEMARFGVRAEPLANGWRLPGGQRYRGAEATVEGDWSQGAFFLAAGALGRPVEVAGLLPDSHQGDAAIMTVLRDMGAELQTTPRGALRATAPGGLRAVTVDARPIPDLVPPIAALCCFCEGESRIVHAERLRLKESDRLAALAAELAALGADIRETDDGLAIRGKKRLAGGRADAWGDHRIAMAVAVAATRCEGPVTLTGWQHVSKSYPNFWADFEGEGVRA